MHAVTSNSRKCFWEGCPNNPPYASTLRKCARCKEALYCDQTCQARDWSKHKLHCRPFIPPPTQGSSCESKGAVYGPQQAAPSPNPAAIVSKIFGSEYDSYAIGRARRFRAGFGEESARALERELDQMVVDFLLGGNTGAGHPGDAPKEQKS